MELNNQISKKAGREEILGRILEWSPKFYNNVTYSLPQQVGNIYLFLIGCFYKVEFPTVSTTTEGLIVVNLAC